MPFPLQESADIVLLLRMLGLGLGAWDMIDNQVFKEPKLVQPLNHMKIFNYWIIVF